MIIAFFWTKGVVTDGLGCLHSKPLKHLFYIINHSQKYVLFLFSKIRQFSIFPPSVDLLNLDEILFDIFCPTILPLQYPVQIYMRISLWSPLDPDRSLRSEYGCHLWLQIEYVALTEYLYTSEYVYWTIFSTLGFCINIRYTLAID